MILIGFGMFSLSIHAEKALHISDASKKEENWRLHM